MAAACCLSQGGRRLPLRHGFTCAQRFTSCRSTFTASSYPSSARGGAVGGGGHPYASMLSPRPWTSASSDPLKLGLARSWRDPPQITFVKHALDRAGTCMQRASLPHAVREVPPAMSSMRARSHCHDISRHIAHFISLSAMLH